MKAYKTPRIKSVVDGVDEFLFIELLIACFPQLTGGRR